MEQRLRLAGQIVLTLLVTAACVPWLGFAYLLEMLRCDDGCSGDMASDSMYTVQFVWTLAGVGVVGAGLVLGLTRHRAAQWILLGCGALSAAIWWSMVSGL